jgi:hypothetical protein
MFQLMCKPFLRLIALARIQIFTSPDPTQFRSILSSPLKLFCEMSLLHKNPPYLNYATLYRKTLFKNMLSTIYKYCMKCYGGIMLTVQNFAKFCAHDKFRWLSRISGHVIRINAINNYNHNHQVEFFSLPGAQICYLK